MCAAVEGYCAAVYNRICVIIEVVQLCAVCPYIGNGNSYICVIACIDNACYLIGNAVFAVGSAECNTARSCKLNVLTAADCYVAVTEASYDTPVIDEVLVQVLGLASVES